MDVLKLLGPVYRPFLRRSTLLKAIFVRDPLRRYRARHKYLKTLGDRWGMPTYEMNVTWHRDPETTTVWEKFPPAIGPVMERHFNLYYLAKSARYVPGDTAECGVYRGAASWFILNALHDPRRKHHIFDSFAGLSEPDPRDLPVDKEAFSWASGDLSAAENEVRINLDGFTNVKYYKGWIPHRFGVVEDGQFAFVHIDVDLYKPTYDSLEFFYDRTTKGGFLVCDDYGSSTCLGAFDAVNEFLSDKPESVIHLTAAQGIIIKQ